MTGLERRLERLEAAAGVMAELPVIFVVFTNADGTEPSFTTATAGDLFWHRKLGELEEAFRARVAGEARATRPGSATLAFLG